MAGNFAPDTQCGIMPDPGLFYPQTMMGTRDSNVFPLYGQEKIAGPIDAPFFPVNGIPLFVGALGKDNGQSGTAAGTAKNGTLAPAAAGATSLTYTVTNATAPPVANDYIQIGPAVGTFAGTGLAPGVQAIKITSVSGGGPYTLTVPAIPYRVDTSGNGGAGLVAQSVIAPFYHNVVEANALPSFTIEKNLGSFQSEQYAGCKVNKFSLKLPTTNAEASFSCDLMGQSVAILDPPTAVVVDQTPPWVFAEGLVSLFGQAGAAITNAEISLENTVKDTYTVRQSHLAQFITPTTRKVTGKITNVFTSLNDPTWGYFQQAFPSTATAGVPVQGALTLALTHPTATGQGATITLPQVNIQKLQDDIKIGDIIMQTLDFTASYQFSSASSMSATVSNSSNTPIA